LVSTIIKREQFLVVLPGGLQLQQFWQGVWVRLGTYSTARDEGASDASGDGARQGGEDSGKGELHFDIIFFWS